MAQEKKQQIFEGYDSYRKIKDVIVASGAQKIMVVCDRSYDKFAVPMGKYIQELPCDAVYYDKVTPNPEQAEVLSGVMVFAKEKCDFIISVGGGSVIDVAKCINIHATGAEINSQDGGLQVSEGSHGGIHMLDTPRCIHLAVPTTAGSGSESTKFAVVYINGEKTSIEHKNLAPDYVVLEPGFLSTLPLYQKKSTLLDALCQAFESLWAKSATDESMRYANEAKEIIYKNTDAYLEGDKTSTHLMLKASNLSGRAINITKTTAAHAMSYKISTSYVIPHDDGHEVAHRHAVAHGHAVALCMPYVWEHYIANGNLSSHEKDKQRNNLQSFIIFTQKLDLPCKLEYNESAHEAGKQAQAEIEQLVDSVNTQRLGNHPILISKDELADMYKKIIF